MVAEAPFLAVMATAGAAVIDYVGLLDESGVELVGGTYARLPVTATATGGVIELDTDLTFDVPAGATVGGWSGFSAVSAGTRYGGAALTPEVYTGAGEYTLIAADSGFTVSAS